MSYLAGEFLFDSHRVQNFIGLVTVTYRKRD